jgi:hypothetical protein
VVISDPETTVNVAAIPLNVTPVGSHASLCSSWGMIQNSRHANHEILFDSSDTKKRIETAL